MNFLFDANETQTENMIQMQNSTTIKKGLLLIDVCHNPIRVKLMPLILSCWKNIRKVVQTKPSAHSICAVLNKSGVTFRH